MISIHIQVNKTMNLFSNVLFLPLTFCLQRSLSAVSNSFYLSFFRSSPTLSRSLLMQSPIPISVFLASISPPLYGHSSLPVFYLPYFAHDQPMQPSPIFLRTFLHSNFHSHFINFLLSPLLTPTIILTRLFFANLDFFVLFLC